MLVSMILGLASCQSALETMLPADAAQSSVAGSSAKGGAGRTATASADDMRKALTPEERKRKIAEFLAKPEVKQTSQGLEELAKLVAVAVEDESLRNQIYARCMEKFDGETNVLWKQLDGDSKLRASGGGLSERIEALAAKNRNVAGGSVVQTLGGVQAAIGQFEKTFQAPVHLFWIYPSTWDRKTTPLVAFVPRDVDPDTRTSIPAFDSKGNRFDLDSKGLLAKQRPVLVVTFNERADIQGKVREDILVASTNSQQGASISKSPTKTPAARTASIGDVYLYSVYIDFEGEEFPWDGAAEFIYTFRKSGTSGWTNHYLGWNQKNFFPNRYHNSENKTCYFDYYEDDFTSGEYDVFDDIMGQQGFTPYGLYRYDIVQVTQFTTASYTIYR
jgi:hypothetical protein